MIKNHHYIRVKKQDSLSRNNHTKEDVKNLLRNAINNNKVISRQHCEDGINQLNSFYQDYVQELKNISRKFVGVLEGDVAIIGNNQLVNMMISSNTLTRDELN